MDPLYSKYPIVIENTLTGKKEAFIPVSDGSVGMYVCGPTVYSDVHLGNARTFTSYDFMFRYFRHLGYQVRYVRNITDAGHLENDAEEGEDKIAKKARMEQLEPMEIVQRYTVDFHKVMEKLNALPPSIEPTATGHIVEQIQMIKTILEKGWAYQSNGSVYFDVENYNLKGGDYGVLSGRKLEELQAGTRVLDGQEEKRNPADFALWKKASPAHIMRWPSPWSDGFPGWHLECSAMIETHLGETIDIHGGGRDLVFPHHENEVAQSQCAHDGKLFVRYWMHNGYINIDGEKMSKSLGNFKMVRDLLDHYAGETLRFALLSAQYRSELSFSVDLLDQAKSALDTLYGALKQVEDIVAVPPASLSEQPAYTALLDDLNTPIAIRELHALAKSMTQASGSEQAELKGQLLACAELLGLLQQSPGDWFQQAVSAGAMSVEQIESLMAARQQAKIDKNYAGADEIRAELLSAGVVLEDSREGTTWRRE